MVIGTKIIGGTMENTRVWFNMNRNYYFNNLDNKCINCGKLEDLHLHHIIPISIGGTNKLSNVVILCSKCHGKLHGIKWYNHSELTKKGIETARLNGKQIGGIKGAKLTTKKSIEAKKRIQKYSKDFQGTLKDTEVMKLIGLARNTYYKYKKELVQELSKDNN